MTARQQSKQVVNTSDMKRSISQVNQSVKKANTDECEGIVCVLDRLLKNINSSQKTISKQMDRVSSHV